MKNKMKDFLGNLDKLKEKITKMCIDMTGTMQNKKVLVRVVRGSTLSLEYYENGYDGYNNNERFWYEFPVYRDMTEKNFNNFEQYWVDFVIGLQIWFDEGE
jgi:hypothetical protein